MNTNRRLFGKELSGPASFSQQPNPEIPKFIKQFSVPYAGAEDSYDVPAFDKDLLVNKAAEPKAIYDMHLYWSKKHWAAIREYIGHYLPRKFYPDGKGLILDPFSGSGMTGVAALMENKSSILIDPSPGAAFIAHHYVNPVGPEEIEEAYRRMMGEVYEDSLVARLNKIAGRPIQNLEEELEWLYETVCDRCGGKAITEYLVYSQTFQCPKCGEIVALYDCPKVLVNIEQRTGKTKEKQLPVCPACYTRNRKVGRSEFVISTRSKRHGEKPVLVSYLCQERCTPKRDYRKPIDKIHKKARFFQEHDKDKLDLILRSRIPHPYPEDHFPIGHETRHKRRLDLQGVLQVGDIYTKRNFWALSAIRERAKNQGELATYLLAPLTAGSLILSRMCREATTQTQNGTYYIPQVSKALNVSFTYESKIRVAVKAMEALAQAIGSEPSLVSCEVNSTVKNWQAESVDYIFTDPPYADKVQYGELNFVWEAWLEFDGSWRKHEIVVKNPKVDPERTYTFDKWEERIREAFRACHRILKPGRWMSVCYHDTSEGTWRRVQDALLDIGFEIHSVTVLDPLQKSTNQITAEKVVKSDLVLNCRKPRPGESAGKGITKEPVQPIRDRVRTIIEDALSTNPGLTRDKLFDLVTRRLLERAQFVEHRFEEILVEVAMRAEGDRWYLKAELEQLSGHDLANEEAAGESLIRFARLRCQGTPAKYAAVIALDVVHLSQPDSKGRLSEDLLEKWINAHLLKEDRELLAKKGKKSLELGGRLAGIEFYDALFFYFTRYMKGKNPNKLPRRNLPEFLEEYLIHFKEGDKWLYRPPDEREAVELRKARQSGLGRRIRAFTHALREGNRTYIDSHRPNVRTFVEWLRYCAAYGRYEEGAILYDDAGFTVGELKSVVIDEKEEETAYDVARGFAEICKRKISRGQNEDVVEEDEREDE